MSDYHLAGSSFFHDLVPDVLMLSAQIMLLPVVLIWMYWRRRWTSLAVAGTLFLLGVDFLMPIDRGSMAQTFTGAVILFGVPYAMLAVWMELSCHVGQRIRADTDALLSAKDQLMLTGLALLAYLFFFAIAATLDLPDQRLLSAVGAVVNCLFHLPQPVRLADCGNALDMLIAFPPALTVTIMLHAWFCRHLTHKKADIANDAGFGKHGAIAPEPIRDVSSLPSSPDSAGTS